MFTLIINSPLFRDHNVLYDEDALPPLGLGYIATQLQKQDIKVELIDAVNEKIGLLDLIIRINSKAPDFVAVNIFTTNSELVQELCESLNPEIKIIIGGLSTKQLYKNIIQWDIDNDITVVIGDGEYIVPDIINSCISEIPVHSIDNKKVFLVTGESKYSVNDINDLPLDRSFFKNEPIDHYLGFQEANIVASRGCVYNCTFCAAARSLNKEFPVRERSIQSISTELEEILTTFPSVDSIRVLDDLFLKNNKSIKIAINVFTQFSVNWRSMAHVMTFNNALEQDMINLRKSGCYELFIGIESGSPVILKSINKTHNIEKIVKNLTKAFKAGINLKGYFIYGFPNESAEDMELTFELAKKLKSIATEYRVNFRTSVFQYRPYHGTQIYHDLESDGIDLNNQAIEPNPALSNLVGRLQFNFHNGNYSNVSTKVLNDYIYRTTNLNGGEIFARLEASTRP